MTWDEALIFTHISQQARLEIQMICGRSPVVITTGTSCVGQLGLRFVRPDPPGLRDWPVHSSSEAG